jgi:hypothetical protein
MVPRYERIRFLPAFVFETDADFFPLTADKSGADGPGGWLERGA